MNIEIVEVKEQEKEALILILIILMRIILMLIYEPSGLLSDESGKICHEAQVLLTW